MNCNDYYHKRVVQVVSNWVPLQVTHRNLAHIQALYKEVQVYMVNTLQQVVEMEVWEGCCKLSCDLCVHFHRESF